MVREFSHLGPINPAQVIDLILSATKMSGDFGLKLEPPSEYE